LTSSRSFRLTSAPEPQTLSIAQAILAAAPNTRLLGVTATPQRLDGKGLDDIYEVLISGPDVRELVRIAQLCPAHVYAPSNEDLDRALAHIKKVAGDYSVGELSKRMSMKTVLGDAVKTYESKCPGRPAIAFCCDLNHSKLVMQEFLDAGIRAAHIDGTTPPDERQALIDGLDTGEIEVLCNCGLISEGSISLVSRRPSC
jgi:DNA repair protein RadD